MDKEKKFSLPKENILRHRKDFKHIFSFGRRIGNKYFQIFYDDNRQGQRRIAVILGKKFGKAPLRNKIRRRIREIYRMNKEIFPPQKNYIIIPRGASKYLCFEEMKDNLANLMKKL